MCNCFLFENRIVGEMVDFNMEKSKGLFRLEHLPFEYILLSIENLAAEDIVVSLSTHTHFLPHSFTCLWNIGIFAEALSSSEQKV